MSPPSYIVYIQLHIFLNIQVCFSWIAMNLYTQSLLFSIQIKNSCLHTVAWPIQLQRSPHSHISICTSLSYIHVSLLYTTSVISLYTLSYITSCFSFTSSYIFHTMLFSQIFPTHSATSPFIEDKNDSRLLDRSTGKITIKSLHSLNAQLTRKHKGKDPLSTSFLSLSPDVYTKYEGVFILNKCIPVGYWSLTYGRGPLDVNLNTAQCLRSCLMNCFTTQSSNMN